MSDCFNHFNDAMDELCLGGRGEAPSSLNSYYSWQEVKILEEREKSYKVDQHGIIFFVPKSIIKEGQREGEIYVHTEIFKANRLAAFNKQGESK